MHRIAAHEIRRKLIHLSSLIYPLLYLLLQDQRKMLWLSGSVLVLVLAVDVLRNLNASFNRLFSCWFCFALHAHERAQTGKWTITGSTHFMIGTFFTIWLFPQYLAILALYVLIIADTCAALTGMAYGNTPIYRGKSLEGFLAFSGSAGLISLAGSQYFQLTWYPLIYATITASLLELFSDMLHFDDNTLIPLGYGLTAWLTMPIH